jgi:hypothetical protein
VITSYELQTAEGRAAAASLDAATAADRYDRLIEIRLRELFASDPVLLALATLRGVAIALPAEANRRGWVPSLAGSGQPVQWRPPPE